MGALFLFVRVAMLPPLPRHPLLAENGVSVLVTVAAVGISFSASARRFLSF